MKQYFEPLHSTSFMTNDRDQAKLGVWRSSCDRSSYKTCGDDVNKDISCQVLIKTFQF